jgi:DNA-directed RNA polymerase subunit RPC12/RpoP
MSSTGKHKRRSASVREPRQGRSLRCGYCGTRPELLKARTGVVRENPLLKTELGCRAFTVRCLARLGLDVEPIGRVGRPTAPWGMR